MSLTSLVRGKAIKAANPIHRMKAGVVRKCVFGFFWLVGISVPCFGFFTGTTPDKAIKLFNQTVKSCLGEITIGVRDGVAPYTFSWTDEMGDPVASDDQSDGTLSKVEGLSPGKYFVLISDSDGDTLLEDFTIADPFDLVFDIKITDVKCKGGSDGVIEVEVTNATAPIIYELFDSLGNSVASGSEFSSKSFDIDKLKAGDYTLNVQDFFGCTGTANITINEPATSVGVNLIEKIDPLCFGDSTGSITVKATGGTITTIGYIYQWFNSTNGDVLIEDEEEALLDSLAAGSYKVRIRDENGCVYIEEFFLTDPPELIISDSLIEDASCNGLSDGSVDITVEGGTGTLSYAWSNGASTQNISNLTAGTYTVTITDDNDCTLTESYEVGQPTAVSINETINNVACKGESAGAISVNVSGGSSPYTYAWSNGSSGTSISSLLAGSYTITVTDATGCNAMKTVVITEPAAGLGIDGFTENIPVCAGGNDGSLEVSFSGGVAPFSFSWSNGGNTQEITGLSANMYTVTITDNNNCTAVGNFTLNDPPPIAVAVTPVSPDCNGDTNGSISVSASNGTAPFNYSWSTGSTDPMISGLAAGAYTVTVTDDIGCSIEETIMLTEPDVLMVNGMDTDVSCQGFANAGIVTAVNGGTAPYTYSWSNGANTENISSLAPGMYSVTVTDANDCEAIESYTITEPAELVASASPTDILCKGDNTGAVSLSVSGGTSPYTYQWSSGAGSQNLSMVLAASYTVTVTDANGCEAVASATVQEPATLLVVDGVAEQITCNGGSDGAINMTISGGEAPYILSWSHGSTSEDLDDLGPGTYTITVTDNLGCVKMATYEITDPPVLSASGIPTPVSCKGAANGSVSLSVIGGEGPYDYAWTHGPATKDVSNLEPGFYSVAVTDSRGCTTSESFTITEPDVLSSSSTQTEINCKGAADGTVEVTVAGGTVPYTYSWSNGSTNKDLNGVIANTYTLTITDNRGCTTTETVTLTEPAEGLTVSPNITDVVCSGASTGSIELTVSGGTGPYTYLWNTGATTKDIMDVLPGTYEVTVTDSQQCTRFERYNVIAPDALSISESVSDLSCFESGDGTIDVNVSGGTLPYTYLWSDGATTEDLGSLAAGTYSITVTDAGNCSISGNFTVAQPTEIIVNPFTRGVSCFGETDGLIDISVSGGLGPYTYAWSEGSSTQNLSGLTGGTYTVTVTDNTNCQVTTSIMVEAPDAPLSATGAITDIGCNGDQSGGVVLTVTGGTAPYRFVWSNGSTLQNLQNVFPGTYDVTITDDNDCTFEASFDIGESDPIEAAFDVTEPTCPNDANGVILLDVSGGAGPYTYFWSNGSTSKDQFNLPGGPYTVTIRDTNNCTVTRSVDIGGTRGLEIRPRVTPVSCKGAATGAVSVDIFGGSGNYAYTWSNGSTTKDQSGLTAGLYELTVTDEDGCDSSITVIISEPSQVLSASVSHTDKLVCFGGMEGEARVIPNGGTAPYNYLWSTGDITSTISNLSAGNYNVLVTDAKGCNSQYAFVIEEPDAPITVTPTGKLSLSCHGDSDGSITATISGGEGPYELFWNNGRRTNTIDNLAAGDYILRVVDSRGCIREETINISQPEALVVANARVNDTECYGDRTGSIELDIEGGTAPYTYLWSNGATSQNLSGVGTGDYIVEVTDDQGCTLLASFSLDNAPFFGMVPAVTEISCTGETDASVSLNIVGGTAPYSISWSSGQDDETITNLGPGEYTARVTDGNGCMLEQTFILSDPLPLTIDGVVSDADACDNPESGAVHVQVTGGRGPYQYSWSNGATTSSITNVAPGFYTLTVTDAFGCTEIWPFTVTRPNPITIDLNDEIIVDCDNRSAFARVTADVAGGFGAYQYSWSKGNGLDATLELADPGRLTLLITDGRGCQRMENIDLEFPAFAIADFVFDSESYDRDRTLSANDPITFTDNSGPGAVSWSWDFGDGFGSTEQNPVHTYASLGDYRVTLTVTDGAECITTYWRDLDVQRGFRVMIPSAFTPDGDGLNDLFRPKFIGLKEITLLIYNRWGELVFSTSDLRTPGWDGQVNGQPAPNDNYTYRFFGKSFNNFPVDEAGGFKLVR